MAKGDHIKVKRYRGLYTHHGIDIGDGTVVHFSGEPLKKIPAEVRRDPLEAFTQGARVRVVRHRRHRPLEEDAVVSRALARIGERDYTVWGNNCEHFATYCKTGKAHSGQVRRVAGLAAAGAVVAGGIALAVFRGRRGPTHESEG